MFQNKDVETLNTNLGIQQRIMWHEVRIAEDADELNACGRLAASLEL